MGAIRKIIPTTLLAGLVVYFGYHGLTGEQGVLASAGAKTRIAELEQELDQERARRVALENHAGRLRDGSLDLDLLDERARTLLNVSDAGEYVIRLDETASHIK